LSWATNESGVVDDGNFWRFEWLLLWKLQKASNIKRRYATPCRPVIDCKMNDLEWLYHVKLGFRTSSFRLRGFNF